MPALIYMKDSSMETVNALKLRNNLGEVLDRLKESGEPILVSKSREVQAVLITPEQFQTRFLDKQNEAEKKRFLADIKALRAGRKSNEDSLDLLRQLRGYDS